MKREIVFRGQDVKGKWHIGLLAHIGNAWYVSNKAGIPTAIEVIPRTIGQYTGLTDKNGRRIFEGDIVDAFLEEERGIVEWDEDTARFVIKLESVIADFDNYRSEDLEVIGNVYDNPELIEE